MDSKRYFLFAAINPDISGSIGFTSFTDLDGNHYRAINGYTPYGVPRDFGVTFTDLTTNKSCSFNASREFRSQLFYADKF